MKKLLKTKEPQWMKNSNILSWKENKLKLKNKIESIPSDMKLLVKTKNETKMLSEWFEYHADIVGRENIIVADNNSSLTESIEILNDISKTSVVFSFSEFHDDIHDRAIFSELYDALSVSCDFYMFMDADERLVWIEDDEWLCNKEIIGRIKKIGDFDILPGVMLDNFPKTRKRFCFDGNIDFCKLLTQWGKPVIKASSKIEGGHRLHNCQFPERFLNRDLSINIFTLHLFRLDPEQRLRANIEKLIARKLIDRSFDFQKIREINTLSLPNDGFSARCLKETIEIIKFIENNGQGGWITPSSYGFIELDENHSLVYGSESIKKEFHTLQKIGAHYIIGTN